MMVMMYDDNVYDDDRCDDDDNDNLRCYIKNNVLLNSFQKYTIKFDYK